jgi:heterodisulfide reductase subunit A
MDINVAAVILSPGLEPYDPSVKDEYGYGRLQNVVTSMDFERLLCATGIPIKLPGFNASVPAR